jgi:uncharacterized protein YdhG (YjbR/CyaY superfamily)
MQSRAKDVDSYLKEVPADREQALARLRALCLSTLAGYEESMAHGMPSYSKAGIVEVAFASQKNYISFYILKEEVLDNHRPSLEGVSLGKGCIRYSKPEKINLDVVQQLLEDTMTSEAEIC